MCCVQVSPTATLRVFQAFQGLIFALVLCHGGGDQIYDMRCLFL